MNRKTWIVLILTAAALLLVSGCAANNEMYIEKTAGFWAGLWHGLICFIAFIISLFTDNVGIYEINNTGGWYNFGFILGAMIALGGSSRAKCRKKPCGTGEKEREWEEIGVKVEEKVRIGIKNWLDETDDKDQDWEEIAKKVEEKIKRELKNWAEK